MKDCNLNIALTILIFLSPLTISDGWKIANIKRIFDIPISVASDILTILINGTVHLVGNCTQDTDASLVEYWLYTQTNPDGELITGLENIDSNKQVIILLHGWHGHKNIHYIVPIRNAYLQRFDANVIVVDYEAYSNGTYQSAYCDVPYVAKNVGNFICQLKNELEIDIPSIHVVGHSLGGQIAGIAGKGVRDMCNEIIGRITGLDPAGPLYQGINPSVRLDKTDAAFVDVIHTNQGQNGYIGSLGHVDFYPNGGSSIQPGCFSDFANLTLETIILLPLNVVLCNHERSCYLFAESITLNSFYSTSVLQCAGICVPDILSPTHCYMGEYLRAPPAGSDKHFTCTTNDKPKYGLGPDGPLT